MMPGEEIVKINKNGKSRTLAAKISFKIEEIRTPLTLAGVVLTAFIAVAAKIATPDNPEVIILTSIGAMPLLALALILHVNVLKTFQESTRVKLILGLVSIFMTFLLLSVSLAIIRGAQRVKAVSETNVTINNMVNSLESSVIAGNEITSEYWDALIDAYRSSQVKDAKIDLAAQLMVLAAHYVTQGQKEAADWKQAINDFVCEDLSDISSTVSKNPLCNKLLKSPSPPKDIHGKTPARSFTSVSHTGFIESINDLEFYWAGATSYSVDVPRNEVTLVSLPAPTTNMYSNQSYQPGIDSILVTHGSIGFYQDSKKLTATHTEVERLVGTYLTGSVEDDINRVEIPVVLASERAVVWLQWCFPGVGEKCSSPRLIRLEVTSR
ncbi:MAG: hypothetical protein NW204_03030 [Xanthomonadaceae bacterium]|nr:hypothetical protein [Xanthomonadaceae bacterium]